MESATDLQGDCPAGAFGSGYIYCIGNGIFRATDNNLPGAVDVGYLGSGYLTDFLGRAFV